MEPEIKSFLGTGWAFPPAFDKANHHVRTASDARDIEQSIRIILSTTPGERLMQPEFGCALKRLVFEKIDSALVAELNHLVYRALLDFEPRVNFLAAEVIGRNDLNGILHIRVDYSIIITNTRHNIVFPFYLLEGTNLPDEH
ncbi:MAG TPA: GPW/gp25 family protein [Chitinophagaceae bacterium]|nr:GPW/gp25 family protein [Chitinophagaceae bacterium]